MIEGEAEIRRGRLMVRCHRCSETEEPSVVYASWLEPVNVWQPERRSWLQTQLCPRCARWTLRYWIRVRWQLRIGTFLSKILGPPHYGTCARCGTSWHFARHHTTSYGSGGCFPLCERCWAELTPRARLPFYEGLWDEWRANGHRGSAEERAQMIAAVLAGK